jgi:hypothetical protein
MVGSTFAVGIKSPDTVPVQGFLQCIANEEEDRRPSG